MRAFNMCKALNLGFFQPLQEQFQLCKLFAYFFFFNKNVSVMQSHLSKWHVITTPQCKLSG